jgi:hypothetical protein
MLNISRDGLAYNFFPNPTDGVLYYQCESEEKETLEIKVMDVLGKLISVKDHRSTVGTNNIYPQT